MSNSDAESGAPPETVDASDDQTPALEPGTRIGRYKIESVLGKGGMGIVYRALDPELGRVVAIKVINDRGSDEASRARVLREAQMMAKLRHPNVVPVFDVGTSEDGIFVVMPLVEGGTLGSWLRSERRPWRDVLDRFLAAGRGLAAAHAGGLVHRDFKPDNVLLGNRGEVLVADFGLAREAEAPAERPVSATDSPAVTGVAGTVAYMAPEQLRGERVDARADQFSFCVSLWEGLHGARPQDAATRAVGLRAALTQRTGENRAVPAWLDTAVVRGFAHDPERRWPSLDSALAYLERRRRLPRRIGVFAAIAALVVGAGTAVVLARSADAGVACGRAGDVFQRSWTRDHQERMEAAFVAARPYGQDTAKKAFAALDAYGARWRATRIDACKATHDRGEQSAQTLDRRIACLDRARTEFDALVTVFAAADGSAIDRALDAIDKLVAPETCDATVADAMPLQPDARTRAVEKDIAGAKAARAAGDFSTMRRLAESAMTGAEALGHPRLLADARVIIAWSMMTTDRDGARSQLEAALGEAVRANDHELEARVGIDLLSLANSAGDTERIESVLSMVRASVGRLSSSSPLRLSFLNEEYVAIQGVARFDDALAICDQMAKIEAEPRVLTLECRCTTMIAAMRNDQASKHCRDALAGMELKHGPDHPALGEAINHLAIVENRLGNYDAALALRERLLRVVEGGFGPDSDNTALALHNLGVLLLNMGRLEQARGHLERALAIYGRHHDKPTRGEANTHSALGAVLAQLGDKEGSLREADEALHALETMLGPEHPEVVVALLNNAQTYFLADRCDVALPKYTRGADLALAKLGETHVLRGAMLVGKTECLASLGRAREAIEAGEAAVRIMAHAKTTPKNVGAAHGALGNALLADHQSKRARIEYEKAREIYAAMGEPGRRQLEEADRMLEKIGGAK